MTESYELYAVKYAWRDARRGELFLGGDGGDPDETIRMDYFVWAAVGARRTFVVDTGFSAEEVARRGRTHVRQPADGLALVGVDAASAEDVVLTHCHYDHIGTVDDFPSARLHLQERELQYASGRYMQHATVSHSFNAEEVVSLVRDVFGGRVVLHDGTSELAGGVSIHLIGGHTGGNQVARVQTERGWVVLASDAAHYYEQLEAGRLFSVVFDVGAMLRGYETMGALADSPQHIVPGHDPQVLERYPAPSPELEGSWRGWTWRRRSSRRPCRGGLGWAGLWPAVPPHPPLCTDRGHT